MTTVPQDVLERKLASHKGYKSHLTYKLNAAEKTIGQAQNLGPSKIMLDQLQVAFDHCEIAFDKVEHSLRDIQSIDDPLNFQKYDDAIEKEYKRTSKILETLTTLRVAFADAIAPKRAPPAVPIAGAAAAAPARVKPNDSLKPKPLNRDNTPVELTAWIEKFTAFYVSSRLQDATPVEQHAHFKSCIDAYLTSRLHQHILPNTPVLPDPANTSKCLVEMLQEEFLVQHPLFSRRLDFFNFKQSTGQAFTDYYQKLRKKGDEADLAAMTVDDLYTMRCFTGVTDPELKKEFLKQPNKDSKTLQEVADNYEMARRYVKAMGTPAANTTTVKGKGKGNVGKTGGNKGNNEYNDKAKQLFTEGKCFRCGQKVENRAAHASDCKAKNHTCKHCGKQGHFPNVCLNPNSKPQQKSESATKDKKDKGGEPDTAANATKA